MKVSLYGELLMEIRRLHAAGTSFGVSKQENIKSVLTELGAESPSLLKLTKIIEGDPGLSIAAIKIANCTIINGAASKSMTAKQAVIRIGLNGLNVAVNIYQTEILRRVVVDKKWRDHMSKTMDNVLAAGALSYKIAMCLTGKKADAEWALHLAILYSLGVFAKIIAADSMQLVDSKENRESVLKNSALAAEAVLITTNANYELINAIEKIENDDNEDVSIVAAKSGWGFLMGTMDSVTFNDIELTRNSFKRGRVL